MLEASVVIYNTQSYESTCQLFIGCIPKVHTVSAEKDGGQLNSEQGIEKGLKI